MTHSVDFTGIEDIEGEELKATLEHLNEALANQQRLAREVHTVKRTNKWLTTLVCLMLVVTGLSVAATLTALDASRGSRAAVALSADSTKEALAVRETIFYDACIEYNQRRDFDEQVLRNDAYPPERDRTTVEEVPNLDQLSPDLRDVLIFLDGEGDKTAQQEAERVAVKRDDLEEFIEMFPRRDCEAESRGRIARIDPSIRPVNNLPYE
jgi:hypothetical protein